MQRLGILHILILAATCSFANVTPQETIINQATERNLGRHPVWLGLLYFDARKPDESKIVSQEFFLSPRGGTDPDAELKATLLALYNRADDVTDDHPICRFPARYIWLDRQLQLPQIPGILDSCDNYQTWNKHGAINSVSIIFSTGYLKNPASYYGHILVKFNSEIESPLMDTSLDHGAILDEDDSLPIYIIKGLTGGYEAGFTHSIFYQRNHNYAEVELRDMWEYELALTDDELELLIAHTWELLGNKTTYYFFHENCATAVADLLELILQQDVKDRRFPWLVPATVFKSLNEIDENSRPILDNVRLIPSRQTRLSYRYSTLTDPEKETLKNLIDAPADEYAKHLEDSRIRSAPVLATLLDYYRLRGLQYPEDQGYKTKINNTLRLIVASPTAKPDQPNYHQAPPHHSQSPTTLRISASHNRHLGDLLHFRFRPVYFDYLSQSVGLPGWSELSLFDTEIYYDLSRDKFRLARLDIFNAQTLNASTTDLNDELGAAWKFRLSWERSDLSCDACTVPRFVAGVGKSFRLADRAIALVRSDFTLQENYRGSGTLSLTGLAGMIMRINPHWASIIELGYRKAANGRRDARPVYRWEQRFGRGRDWDIRLSFRRDEDVEVTAGFSIYL